VTSSASRTPLGARAHARAGLLGNPSDVYEGKAIALSVCNFAAEVAIEPAGALELRGDAEGARLLEAALGRFPEARDGGFAMGFRSDIPLQVGLGGSSAIVVAALRALCAWFQVELHPAELAERALRAEAEDLGIVAGPMDRVIQAYGGLVHMDFRPPRGPSSYRRLDPALLPPLFVAWNPEPGPSSGVPHAEVRARWLRGDPEVRAAMRVFPRLVDEGLACLERGDVAGLQRLVDRNFDTRASIWPLGERDLEMVRIGRGRGAAVKFCGSGGAVLGVMRAAAEYPDLAKAYEQAGFRVLRPAVEP
jgi:glucuronokinase